MILIDAIYINNGGGKELLKLLVDKLKSYNIHFLFDYRLLNEWNLDNEQVTFLKPNILNRHFFYLRNKNKFKFVLCFANIPPTIKLNCFVVTYFHNVTLLNNSINFNFFLFLKNRFIRFFEQNTNRWFVQSDVVKNELIQNGYDSNKIELYPFFKNFQSIIRPKEKTFENLTFLYVSTGEPHKNHFFLFEAFVKYSILYPQHTLKVTISENFIELSSFLRKNSFKNIINLGFLSNDKLELEYKNADIFVFPSLRESFGLGLIEATQYGLPIIASSLPYVYEVVKPTCVFDPKSVDSLFSVLKNHELYINKPASLKVSNKLNNLVDLILSYTK